jgi:tyrosyl-tRNA synthetase
MSALGAKPNIGLTMGILPGTDGEIRMSKSLGNHIPINSDAKDMFGKVMSIPDKAMAVYARLATRWMPDEVEEFLSTLKNGELHPRDAKMKLAKEITEVFYGPKEAQEAKEAFINVFQQGNVPDEMEEFVVVAGDTVLDVLQNSGMVKSRGEGRRMVDQNGVRLEGETLNDAMAEFPGSGVLQVGKRRFLRVVKK